MLIISYGRPEGPKLLRNTPWTRVGVDLNKEEMLLWK